MTNIYEDFCKVEREIKAVSNILDAFGDVDANEGLARLKKAYELRLVNLQSCLDCAENASYKNVKSITYLRGQVARLQQIVLTLNSLG